MQCSHAARAVCVRVRDAYGVGRAVYPVWFARALCVRCVCVVCALCVRCVVCLGLSVVSGCTTLRSLPFAPPCLSHRLQLARCTRFERLQEWVGSLLPHASVQAMVVAATRSLRRLLAHNDVRVFVFDAAHGDLVTWSIPEAPCPSDDGTGNTSSADAAAPSSAASAPTPLPGHDGLAVYPAPAVSTQCVRVPISNGLLGEVFRSARTLQATRSQGSVVDVTHARTEAEGATDTSSKRVVLCEPIIGEGGVVVGVAEVSLSPMSTTHGRCVCVCVCVCAWLRASC